MANQEQFVKVLSKYLPPSAEIALYVADLLTKHPVHFKIVRPRKTKLGDFRASYKGGKSQITINGDLNVYSFMITTIHEVAHFYTHLEFGRYVKPHGKEWQMTFSALLQDLPEKKTLPNDIQLAIENYSRKPKASSCTDMKLYRVLSRYDELEDGIAFLEHLPIGASFELDQDQYKILEKARSRYLCERIPTQQKFKVHALAKVKPI